MFITVYYCLLLTSAGVGKARRVGHIPPASFIDLACFGSSVLTLNPTRALPPIALKDD